MEWWIVLGLLALAAGFLIRRAQEFVRRMEGPAPGCGCAACPRSCEQAREDRRECGP